jgi:hypothetical protein
MEAKREPWVIVKYESIKTQALKHKDILRVKEKKRKKKKSKDKLYNG